MNEHMLIHCSRCSAVIGIWPHHMHDIPKINVFPIARCPGMGRHRGPRRWSQMYGYGMLERFVERYAETKTSIAGYRYCGPPSVLVLTLAVLLGVKKRHGEHYRKVRIGGKLLVWTPFHKSFWKELRQFVRQR